MVVQILVGSHLDKISRTEWRHENAAWLLSTVQTGGSDVRILLLSADEFHRENLHFRGCYVRKTFALSLAFHFFLKKKKSDGSDRSKNNGWKVLETVVSLFKPIDLCTECWVLRYGMKYNKLRFKLWRNVPNILSMDAFEGRVQLKMVNWRLSLSGISFLPPPGWIMAAMNWMSTMCVNSPGFSRL